MGVDVQERTLKEKAVRRALILDAARALFLDRGFDATTMDDVAVKAELSKATLYLYFRRKEELYVALLHAGLDDLNDRIRAAAAVDAPAPDRVRAIGRTYAAFYREQPSLLRLLAHFHSCQDRLSQDVAQPCEERMVDGMRVLAGVIADGLEEGSLESPLPVVEVAAMFWASTYGLLRLLCYQTCRECLGLEPDTDLLTIVEDAWTVLLRGLLPGRDASADAAGAAAS